MRAVPIPFPGLESPLAVEVADDAVLSISIIPSGFIPNSDDTVATYSPFALAATIIEGGCEAANFLGRCPVPENLADFPRILNDVQSALNNITEEFNSYQEMLNKFAKFVRTHKFSAIVCPDNLLLASKVWYDMYALGYLKCHDINYPMIVDIATLFGMFNGDTSMTIYDFIAKRKLDDFLFKAEAHPLVIKCRYAAFSYLIQRAEIEAVQLKARLCDADRGTDAASIQELQSAVDNLAE